MKNKIQFGSWEATALMVNLVFVHAMLIFPRDMVKFGGSASWMIPILITLMALGYFAIVVRLYRNIGSVDLIDISAGIGGRTLKVIVGLFIIIFLILTVSIFMGAFSQTLKIISLDKSPIEYVGALFFIGMITAAYYGIEVVARINSFLVPVVITGFILITLGVIPEFKTSNLFPILGDGYASIAKGSILKLSTFASFTILFLMVPFFKKRYLKRVGYLHIIISGLLLVWSTLSFILVFPYEVAVNKKIPIYQMARHIEFGNYVQRIESVFVLICSISVLLFLSVVFTFVIFVFAKTFELKRSRPIILPMAIIVFSLALLSKRTNIELLSNNSLMLILLIGMLLPLLIIILGAAKKVGVKGKGDIKNGEEN
ncbi:MAG: GerAB/ArcD/ProY family transporter [Ruminiclostridium sp.]